MKSIVFICFTPYQLINATYYGRYLNSSSNRILVWHNYTKYKIEIERFRQSFDEIVEISNFYEESLFKRQFYKCLYGGWLFPFSYVNKVLKSKKKDLAVICVFSDQHIISRKVIETFGKKACDVILVEEGMATYLLQNRKIPKSRDWFINLLIGAHYEPFIGANKKIKTIIVKYPNMLPKEKCLNRNIVKQDNVFVDSMWEELFNDVISLVDRSDSKKKRILWLGQPIEMDGVATENQIDWLRNLDDSLNEEYSIVIKSHPRENGDKYVELTQNNHIKQIQLGELSWVPIELLVSIINPDVVMTAYSTAANNIRELGLKCKIIYCYPAFNLTLSKEVADQLNSSDNVFIIHNIEECIDALNVKNQMRHDCSSISTKEDIFYFDSILSAKL